MYVVFEGIDGSGKTSLAEIVAARLAEAGRPVFQTRKRSGFASALAGALRELARDPRHLEMGPVVETLLAAAREAELIDRAVAPRLEAGDVVIADRSAYTVLVQAVWARGLDPALVERVVAFAGGGLVPDLVVYCDVDAPTSRLRRRIQKIREGRTRDSGRKGMSGLVLRERMREGYRALAARDPDRWVVVDNATATLEQATETAWSAIARRLGMPATEPPPPPRPPPRAGPGGLEDVGPWFYGRVAETVREDPARAAFLLLGLDGAPAHELRRDLAALEPAIVAYGVAGLDSPASMQIRHLLARREPETIAEGLGGIDTEPAWELRRALAGDAPAQVAASLRGIDSKLADRYRKELAESVPAGVLEGLGRLDDRTAWALRDALGSASREALALSLRGLDGDRAWEIRDALVDEVPVAVLASIRGLDSPRAWALRERFVRRAPKPVVRGIEGMSSDRAWAIRRAADALGKELLDSIRGVDDERAWALRDRHVTSWPHTAAGSVGALAFAPRGEAFLRRALQQHPGSLMVARKVVAVLERADERQARWDVDR